MFVKKNGRSVKEDIAIIIRGIKEFEKLLPKQIGIVAGKCILAACLPYVAIIFSTCIVNELTGMQNRNQLLLFALLSVGLTFVCYLWKVVLESKISVGYSRLFGTHELLLTNKAYRLPYELLESSEVRSLRERVSGTINLSGGGMASLYWDMEVVFTNLCAAGISVTLCSSFIGRLFLNGKSMVEVIGYLSLLIGLIGICSFVSCRMTGKRFDVAFEVFEEGAKYKCFGEFYTLEYLSKEDAALDVRIFQQEKLILEESHKRCYEHFAKGKVKEMNAVNKYDSVKHFCTALCGGAVYLLVGAKALDGTIGIGEVIMQYAAVTGLILALSELAQIWTDLRNNNTHLINYFAYMDLPEETISEVDTDVAGIFKKQSGIPNEKDNVLNQKAVPNTVIESIRFDHVSFRYPDTENRVLQDINLEITGGESLAIVGQNGSGKTTLIKLLCRLYRPTEGKILLNGKDIWEYDREEYIELLATVFQDFSLFAFSVGENVAATRDYDEKRVEKAIQEVGLSEKLKGLPQGLKQTISHNFEEEGVNLSGGEAQKLAIARAIYKNAPIMILDEPTAALDPLAEAEIYRQFQRISKGKNLVSISHRLSSCRMCDRIVVLDGGKLIQRGIHEELLVDTQGKYHEMWKKQAEYYQ